MVHEAPIAGANLPAAAEQGLREALRIVGLDKADLDALKKGGARKLLVGGWLHAHYPLTRK